jgi:CheY-like chemotaxis protein
MQQLVMNLAVNARDAMPNGGKLNIVLRHCQVQPDGALPAPEMKPGLWVQVDVKDTGSGIAPEIMAHIFEPFFTTKRPDKGTGLGLAQAHGIVAQHAGHLVVASEIGTGTTFSIFLPAHLITDAAAGDSVAQLALLQGHGEKIMVVEDDAVLRASLVELLQQWNYWVVPAANGEAALTYLTEPEVQVDAILSDVVMPRLGGIGLLQALRKQGDHTPIVLMSGHPLGEERAKVQEAWLQPEIVAWLEKPPSSEILAKTLRLALEEATGGTDDKRFPAQA